MFKRLKKADTVLYWFVMVAVILWLIIGVVLAANAGFAGVLIGMVFAGVLILDYYLAGLFYFLGVDKGYNARVYLWLAYLLPPVGYLLIVAMPDRGGNTAAILPDELPDL